MDSKLSKMLLSDAFKNPAKRHTADQIDKDSLLIFGQLHCVDHLVPRDKALNLYELLQEGGPSVHSSISAGDKDFPIVFKKICALVSTDLFKMASADIENMYAGDERKLKNAVD